jgi:Bacterial PH domain
MFLIHEEKAEISPWFKLLAIIPLGMLIGAIVSSFTEDPEAFFVLFGEAILFTAIFYFILPGKYQIYQDKLRIELGKPFKIDIPLSTIKEVRHSSGFKAYAYSGVRFATSSRYVIEIVRTRGMNYVISPQNGDIFLEQLNQAIKATGLR